MLTSGFGIGSPYTIHNGASGLILAISVSYCYAATLNASFSAILFSLIVGLLYGSLISGSYPYRLEFLGKGICLALGVH